MSGWLFGTAAHNPHVQQMVRALDEDEALHAYATGGVDVWRSSAARAMRQMVAQHAPSLDRAMQRRAVGEVTHARVRSRWRWELPRLVAARLGGRRLEDWCWEQTDLDIDRRCAAWVAQPDVEGFVGVEHGALAAVLAANAVGKPAMVAFLSPHARTRARWVDAELEAHPELSVPGSSASSSLASLSALRDARRDREAAAADRVISGSTFTTRSLVEAGLDGAKIITVRLAGPAPIPRGALPGAVPARSRWVYVGPVSVRKGAHYLLRAWSRVAPPGVDLHVYGQCLLPYPVIEAARRAPGGSALHFHGSVPAADLAAVYRDASLLILPTLCDGFGQVVADAMASGVPVITTTNAGSADGIVHGDTGWVIPPADELALASAMAWCATHPTRLFDMRGAVLDAASAWTWPQFRQTFAAAVRQAFPGIAPRRRQRAD